VRSTTLVGVPLSQHDVDELARKVADLKSVASEVAVHLQVGLGREHELAVSAENVRSAAETLLHQLRTFSVETAEAVSRLKAQSAG
jgi:hypothetical protein